MKFKNAITLIILSIIIFSGCTKQAKNIPLNQKYINTRFGYSINFPENWIIGQESQNGDGVKVFPNDNIKDIRVYASNYDPDFSKPFKNADKQGFTKEDITLDTGNKATLIKGEENNKVLYEVVRVSNNIEYHFYSLVPKEFYNQKQDVFLKIAKSFNTTLKGEEK